MSSEPLELLLSLTSACAVAVAAIFFLRPHAGSLGLLDLPNTRKQHGEAVPLIGGIGIAFSVSVTGLMLDYDDHAFSAFLVASLILMITGLLDDRLGLSANKRFGVQAVAALIMVFVAKLVLHDLGDLVGLGAVHPGWFAVPFTVFCVVGLINALNMADGVDGLAGSLGLVSAAGFGSVAITLGATQELGLIAVLVGAITGFLLFNLDHPLRPFRVFMGDAGSNFLGFALVWLAVALTQQDGSALYPISAVWILGLPIIDTVATMLRRMQLGHSPFKSDRTHLHHLLQARGHSPQSVVVIEFLLSAALVVAGVASWRLGVAESVLTLAFVAFAAMYWWVVARLWRSASASPGE